MCCWLWDLWRKEVYFCLSQNGRKVKGDEEHWNNVSIWNSTCLRGFIYLSHDNEDITVPLMQWAATVSYSSESGVQHDQQSTNVRSLNGWTSTERKKGTQTNKNTKKDWKEAQQQPREWRGLLRWKTILKKHCCVREIQWNKC